MNSEIRSKLDTGERVYAFMLAHPPEDPSAATLITRLKGRLERAGGLGTQELGGHRTVAASIDTKDEIRALIRQDLKIVCGFAELGAMDEPGFDERLRLPSSSIGHREFLTTTRAAVAQAEERKEKLVALGMQPSLLEDLATLLTHYEAAVEEKRSGVVAHVGANAELDEVVREIMLIVHLLDRVNSVRFRKNGELLAAWNSTREVVGPPKAVGAEEPAADEPQAPPTTGPGDAPSSGEQSAA